MTAYEESRAEERTALENAKQGDTFYRYNGYNPVPTLVKVTAVKPTQIVLEDGTRISKKNGFIVGGDRYDRRFYKPLTLNNKKAAEDAIRLSNALETKKETLHIFNDFARNLSSPDDIHALHEQVKTLIAQWPTPKS